MTSVRNTTKTAQEKIAPLFSALGGLLIMASLAIGALLLAPTASEYFGSNAKAARDAAGVGSALLAQLQLLAATPRWLTPLTFVGVASFMLGIALLFSAIPSNLKRRAEIMSLCFPQITRFKSEQAQVQQDPKAGPPFSMIEAMMPAWPVMAAMGWMMVVSAFVIGLLVLSPAQATFFSDAKAIREGAQAGSAFVQANVTSHALEAWLPSFKFMGLGFGLMAIVMALGTIAKKLRSMGFVLTSHIPQDLRPQMPPIPDRVKVFQLATVMGVMILAGALVVGLLLASGVVPAYWNNSIADVLNPAGPGSTLLSQLAVVASFHFWLDPLRMLGMALLFTGITIALTVILKTLRIQASLLLQFYGAATS